MDRSNPETESLVDADGQTGMPWSEGHRRLMAASTYWLATVKPDGQPHVRPIVAIWRDDALYFSAGDDSRKARNLVDNVRCAITTETADADPVVEGTAAKVTDAALLNRLAEAYAAKYGWQVTVRDGAFHDAEGAPTAGPPPYALYQMVPEMVFGFGKDEPFQPTRWRFR